MACQKAEALGLFAEQHFAEVSVAQADLAVFRNGAGNAEGLQPDADHSGCVCSLGAACLQGDSGADGVSPNGVFKADGLRGADDRIAVNALGKGDFPALIDGGDAIFFQRRENFRFASFVTFKLCHCAYPPYSLRGSMYLTASEKRPYVPLDFSYASLGSMPALIKSVILPRETNS